MVARLVRDQEVVGSNPVASTNIKGNGFCRCLLCFSREACGIRGEASNQRLRRSEVSTDDKTAATRCFPCASAQGANPVASTSIKGNGFCRCLLCFSREATFFLAAPQTRAQPLLIYA